MTTLIACLSTGKGTWAMVAQLLKAHEWEKVFLVTNEFGRENYKKDDKTELIVIDEQKTYAELVRAVHDAIHGKINDLEVAVNFASGTGKEHMAVLSAILREGVGIRLVTAGESGIEEI